MTTFRVLRGSHRVLGVKNQESGRRDGSYSVRVGGTIESDEDLVAKYGRDKFLRVEDGSRDLRSGPQGAPATDGLDKLPMGELRKYADELNLKYEKTVGRDELLRLVRATKVPA